MALRPRLTGKGRPALVSASPIAQAEEVATTRTSADRESLSRGRSVAVLALSLLAALILVFRAIRTATQDGPLADFEVVGIVQASIAAVLAIAGAAMAARSGRRAALPIGGALVVEVLLLHALAPPRLITAIPLLFALALVMVPARPEGDTRTGDTRTGDARTVRNVLTVVALGLMVPVGFAYLATGLVAPAPDLLGAYALFAVLLTATVRLAVRRSWWVVAMPLLSVGFFVLMLQLGERFLDWSP